MMVPPGGGCRYYGWTEEDRESIEQACSIFDAHRLGGYLAYELADERRGRYVVHFNVAAPGRHAHRSAPFVHMPG